MSYKILLADDSVTVQKIVTLTFSDEGVDVVPVNNGDEAIRRLQSLRPALVMADVSIPGKNGYEICAFVKSHPELKHIPVVLLVPAFEPYDEERAARAGANHHLTKPFQSIRTLIATVKGLIESDTTPKPVEPLKWPNTNAPVEQRGQSSDTDFLREVFAQDDAEVLAGKESDTGDLAEEAEQVPSIDTNELPEAAPASPITAGSAPLSFAALWEDDVLELDDVLPPLRAMIVAPPPPPFPITNLSGSITQSVKLTSVEAITTIPPGVIDEIVSRVAAQVTAQISQQFASQFNQFAAHLTQDVVAQLAQPANARPNAAAAKRDLGDSLLDL